MKASYEKISPTAKFVAYLRSFTDIPFAKEIAVESRAQKAFQELAGEGSESLVRLAAFWEARYKVTDRIIAQHGLTQILEVAAGLSPRGLAMTEDPAVVYVVSDLPEILEQEKAIAETILSRSNGHRPNLHFETANALDRESLLKASAIFRSDQPIAIITEGLFPYLNRSEEEVLAHNIHALLGRYGGVWIVSDVHTKQFMEKASQIDENVLHRRSNISNSTQRNLEGNYFVDHSDIEQFFNKSGFNMEEYGHSNVVEDLSSTMIMNPTQEEMVKIQQVLRMLNTLILIPQKM